MSARSNNLQSTLDTRPPVDSEMKRTEIDEVAEVKVTFNTRVRNRLEQLLGTDVLRLNDRQYMRTLMRRIYEDQEHSLQCRTETRQMQENKRLKGLVEDMKMDKPPDMVETAFVVSFKKTKAEMEKVQRKQFNKRHNIKKRKTVSCAELDSEDEASPEVEDLTTNEQYHHSSFLGTTLDLSPEEDDSALEEQRQRQLAELAIKFGKYKEPLVQLLLQEGTVPRLYDLAEIILVKPPKPQKKKKAAVEQEEPAAAEPEPELSSSDSAEERADSEEEEEEEQEEEEEGEGSEAEGAAEETDQAAAAVDSVLAENEAPTEGETPAENEAVANSETPGGDSEATDGAAADTSGAEETETSPDDEGAETGPEGARAGGETTPSEGYTTAESGADRGEEEEEEEQQEEAVGE